MLRKHLGTVVTFPNGADCALEFMRETGACVAGSAAVKSFLRVANLNGNKVDMERFHGSLTRDTDVDFWVPCPPRYIIKNAKEYLLDTIREHFKDYKSIETIDIHTQKALDSDYAKMYSRLQKHVSTIVTLDKGTSVPKMQFMLLCPGVTPEDAVRAFDIRGLQFSLGLSQCRDIHCHMDFIAACDVTREQGCAADDLVDMRIRFSHSTYTMATANELVKTLDRVVKYVRDYGWRIDDNEAHVIRYLYDEKSRNLHGQYKDDIHARWTSIIETNKEILPKLMCIGI